MKNKASIVLHTIPSAITTVAHNEDILLSIHPNNFDS